jgi:ABC-2 type transport system permease protein
MVSAHVGPVLEEIYMSNPVTLAVLGFQRTVWLAGESAPVVTHLAVRLLIALGIGVVFLWLSQRIFSVMQRDFAQEL